jgi:hypothetical protein
MAPFPSFTMAAPEAATQQASVSERKDFSALADACALGGRVKPGHGEFGGCDGYAALEFALAVGSVRMAYSASGLLAARSFSQAC